MKPLPFAFLRLLVDPNGNKSQVLEHINANHVCDKQAKTTVSRGLEDNELNEAIAAMARKHVCNAAIPGSP